MGDFTSWLPLKLMRAGDVWQAPVELRVGTHHINVSIDGGPWRAPRGLPVTNDGFGGENGVLVVQ